MERKRTNIKKAAPMEGAVTIRIAGIGTGSPHDSFRATEPRDIPALTLTDASGVSYRVIPGVETIVPSGEYKVKLYYVPDEEGRVLGGIVYSRPPFSVDCTLAVKAGVAEYEVPGRYECFALVADTEAEDMRIRAHDGRLVFSPWLFGPGREKVLYVHGRFDFPGLDVDFVRKDGGKEVKRTYVNDKAWLRKGKTLAEYGKWYSSSGSGRIGVPAKKDEQTL